MAWSLLGSSSAVRAPGELCGYEQHEEREEPTQGQLRKRSRRQHAELDAADRGQPDDRGSSPADVPAKMLPPGAGHDDWQDREQRRRFGLDLAEVEKQYERRHEDQAAADSEQTAERARKQPDQEDGNDLPQTDT